MNLRNLPTWSWMAIAPLLLLGCPGCVSVVRPPPLVVESPENNEVHVVKYPSYIIVHDSESFWDAHQVKDNLVGLADGEVMHWIDLGVDGVTPGPSNRPVENGIEWIKNNYAQLPDSAPVRIVDGLFSALGIEKTTVVNAFWIAMYPTNPVSYCAFTRVVYLTYWVQETLGEANTGAGYLAPWEGPFVPKAATEPVNKGTDWTQRGAIALYVYVFQKVNIGLDSAIDGCEYAWGGMAWCFVDTH